MENFAQSSGTGKEGAQRMAPEANLEVREICGVKAYLVPKKQEVSVPLVDHLR